MTDATSGSPTRQKRAADGGQVADGQTDRAAKTSAEVSPRQSMPTGAPELGDDAGMALARGGTASTAQAGAADEDMAEDSLQGTELLSMMNEIGEEELELETELELKVQQLQQQQPPPPPQPPQQQQKKKGKNKGKRHGRRRGQGAKEDSSTGL